MPAAPRLVAALADRYAFERELGQGGMATVYLADDLRHHRKVAIKVLRPELAATIGPDRFFREIRIAAQLQHPHILPLLESGEAEGFLFYVMPFVDGQSLRDRLAKTGELPVHEAVKLLAEIVDALSYAHARGVVHRDVKPDNVMLSGRHALVMDFGVAKAVSEASGRNQLTTAGVALGTPAYMAPEQAAADPNLDHRVDIYAVGAMAYELLAGRPPFVGGTPQQVLAAHVTQTADPVTRYRPGISAALEAVIMRCLAKRPADRFQTADELLAQLEPLVTPSGGMTPTSTRPIEGWRPDRAPKKLWIGLAAAGIVAVAAVAWAMQSGRSAGAALRMDRAQLTFSGNAAAPSLSPDGRRLAYARRECDSAGYCTQSVIIEDVGGAGSARILSGALAIWEMRWTGDGRHIVAGAYLPEGWGNYAIPTLGGGHVRLPPGIARPMGNGDTTLTTWKLPGDSIAWTRRVATASGMVYDSIPLASPPGEFPQVEVTSDGEWLVYYSEPDGRVATRGRLVITDRTGKARDSLIFTHDRAAVAVPLPGTNAIAVFTASETSPGSDVIVYRYGRSGRLSERPDTVLHNLDAQFAGVGPGGELLLLAGTREFSVWSFRWDDPRRIDFSLQRLAVATSLPLTGSVSPDGSRIFLVRSVVRDGREVLQPSVVPADSGPERLLGPPRLLVDWDWTQPEIVIAERQSDSLVVGTLDPGNGRYRRLRAFDPDSIQTLEALPGGGIVYYSPLRDRVYRALAPNVPDTSFAAPSGIEWIRGLDPSPDGSMVAVTGFGDLSGDSLLVSVMSLADGSGRQIAGLAGDAIDTPRWLTNGDLLVPVFETEWTLVLYRVSIETGTLVRLGPVPRFPGSYRFSADGRRGIIRASDVTSDVHVIRNFRDLVEGR